MISKMADNPENLRKQIAFWSNLIDSHKNDKQNNKPVVKNMITNSKQNKTWTRWKSDSALNKNHLDPNKQRGKGREIVNSPLSRNVQNNSDLQQSTNQQKSNPSIKYKLHARKLTSTKSASAIHGHVSLSKTNDVTKTPVKSSHSVTKSPFKMVARTPTRDPTIKQPSGTLGQPKGNLTWRKNEKKSPQIENLESNRMVSSSSKTLNNNPVLSSSKSDKPLQKTKSLSTIINRHSSSRHLTTAPSTLDRRAVVLPVSANSLTKNTSLHPLLRSDSHNTLTSDQRNAALPKSGKSLVKSMSFPTAVARNSLNNHSNSISALDKMAVQLPKSQKPASHVVNNTNISNAKSITSLSRRVAHSPKSHIITNLKVLNKTSNSKVQSLTSLDKRTTTLPKSYGTPLKVSTQITKSTVPNATIPKGAKFKWRRRSVSQLKNDSVSKNPKSKNLFGNKYQSHIALKSKWQKANSTTLRKTVSSAGQSRTSGSHIPKNSKCVFHSPYTKKILQSRAIPRRSRLKWSKSLSHLNLSTKSNQPAVRSKAKFAHNSRFCLKRRKSIEGKASGVNRNYLHSSPGSKVTSQNKGFFARRMKYISSHTQNRCFISKLKTNAQLQLKRKIKIGGSVYLISSHGKSLKKTTPSKDNKTMFSPSPRRYTVRLYRRPSVGSSTTVNKIFKRQNSVDKNKTQKANKILKRTLQNVQAVMRKVNKKKTEEYCMFYNKFGKCTKHTLGKCPYIHDPTKIAVCTRFLRGKCQKMDGTCPFSHKIDKEKMPICQYFLKGKCTRDDCPYSHVNVGRQAVVCEDFLKGYCALGIKCKKKHVLECEEFNRTGECRNRNKCKLIHRKKVQQRKRYFDEESSLDEEDNIRVVKRSRRKSSDGFLPLEGLIVSDDENLVQSYHPNEEMESSYSIRIRPNFNTKENTDEEQ